MNDQHTGAAIRNAFISPNVSDSNLEPANVVDVLAAATDRIRQLASAITPIDAGPGKDATGGNVGSLTEAIMGVTAGLVRIADAIDRLAESNTRV